MRQQVRPVVVALVLLLALSAGWRIGVAPVVALAPTYTLDLLVRENAVIACGGNALRMDRIPDRPLSVAIYCYQEQSGEQKPAGKLQSVLIR